MTTESTRQATKGTADSPTNYDAHEQQPRPAERDNPKGPVVAYMPSW